MQSYLLIGSMSRVRDVAHGTFVTFFFIIVEKYHDCIHLHEILLILFSINLHSVWFISICLRPLKGYSKKYCSGGNHGYDNLYKSMQVSRTRLLDPLSSFDTLSDWYMTVVKHHFGDICRIILHSIANYKTLAIILRSPLITVKFLHPFLYSVLFIGVIL